MIATSLAATLFALWFVATVLNQPTQSPIRRVFAYGLIPQWTFFAPEPATFDFEVFYRDSRSEESMPTPWVRYPTGRSQRGPIAAVWNPGKRVRKANFDICQALGLSIDRDDGNDIELTVPYLCLLNAVTEVVRPEQVWATQFAVATRDEHGLQPMFTSRWHRVSK